MNLIIYPDLYTIPVTEWYSLQEKYKLQAVPLKELDPPATDEEIEMILEVPTNSQDRATIYCLEKVVRKKTWIQKFFSEPEPEPEQFPRIFVREIKSVYLQLLNIKRDENTRSD